MKPLLLVIICVLFVSPCPAQKNRKTKTQKSSISTFRKDIKIDKKQPSIYITFQKFGKRTPIRDNESNEGIFLKLHNNLRYSIRFCAFGISEEGEKLIMYGRDARIGLYYDVVLNQAITNDPPFAQKATARKEASKIEVPIGYPMNDICHGVEIKAGKSLMFDVPKEHLARGLSIKLGFNYEWEEESEEKPTHFIYFNSLNIPK